MNYIINDISEFKTSFALADNLAESTFLVTGATGLIGSCLIRCLLSLGKGLRIIAPVRDSKKAQRVLGDDYTKINVVECDILTFDYDTLGTVDYIVHCAAPTSSKFFVEHPVETFSTILDGTSALLRYAQNHEIKSFVYLSSLEVYGDILDDALPVTENVQGYLNPLSERSSYPMAKRAAENLCYLYAKEYAVPVKVARLAQTTGAGVDANDNRAIAQFARRAVNNEDIVLFTTGESARPCCYIIDGITAILYILLRGGDGEAYNVANEETYISVRGMAEFVRDTFNNNISVCVKLQAGMGYPPTTRLRLSTGKLENLGWKPCYDLKTIFQRLIDYFKENKTNTI